jgi:hypothetical protein
MIPLRVPDNAKKKNIQILPQRQREREGKRGLARDEWVFAQEKSAMPQSRRFAAVFLFSAPSVFPSLYPSSSSPSSRLPFSHQS